MPQCNAIALKLLLNLRSIACFYTDTHQYHALLLKKVCATKQCKSRSRRCRPARAGSRVGHNRRVGILGRAVGQVSPVDIDGREADDAAAAVAVHRDRDGLRLGARAGGLVAGEVVGQRGEVCGEGEALQRLGGPLLLGVAPVPFLDPEPVFAVGDDAQQAVWVAVAVEEAVVGAAVARGVWAAKGAVSVGHLDRGGVVAIRVDGGLEAGDGEGCGERTAFGCVGVEEGVSGGAGGGS